MSIFGKRQYHAGLTEATAETDGRRAEIDADSYQFGLYGSWSETAFYLDSSLIYSSTADGTMASTWAVDTQGESFFLSWEGEH